MSQDTKKTIINKYLEFALLEYKFLISLQNLLIINDISLTSGDEVKKSKEKWYKTWSDVIFKSPAIKKPFSTEPEIKEQIQKFDRPKLVLFLLEALVFVPYFPLEKRGSGVPKKNAFTEESRKYWKARLESLLFDLPEKNDFLKDLNQIETCYKEAFKGNAERNWKSIRRSITIMAGSAVALGVTGGVAAPYIGGLIGAALFNLSGAAAISAGLAALGGGALAIGGAGMAGGTAVIVGGGAILGSVVGLKATTKNTFSCFDTNFLLTQVSKIETIARLAVEKSDLDDFIRAVVYDLRENLESLKKILEHGQVSKSKKPKLDDRTIKRNTQILENAIKRLREVF